MIATVKSEPPVVKIMMNQSLLRIRDLSDFDPSQMEEVDSWFERFNAQLETEEITSDIAKFNHFLKYANGPTKAWSQVAKFACKEKPEDTTDATWKGYNDETKEEKGVFNWKIFQKKLKEDLPYLTGRPTIDAEIVYKPNMDIMEFFYARLAQIKRERPKIKHYTLEQLMTRSLPADLKMFINPSMTEKELRHNFLVGHERYLEHYTSPRVMVVKSIIDGINKLTLKKKNPRCIEEKHKCEEDCEKGDCVPDHKRIYPMLEQIEREMSKPEASAPPEYSEDSNMMYVNSNRNNNYRSNYRSNFNQNQPRRSFPNNYQQANNFRPNQFRRPQNNYNRNFRNSNSSLNRSNYNQTSNQSKNVTCYKCGTPGHYSNACRSQNRNDASRGNSKNGRRK